MNGFSSYLECNIYSLIGYMSYIHNAQMHLYHLTTRGTAYLIRLQKRLVMHSLILSSSHLPDEFSIICLINTHCVSHPVYLPTQMHVVVIIMIADVTLPATAAPVHAQSQHRHISTHHDTYI